MIPNNRPMLVPIHPGEILLEEYLKPLGLSQYKLAKAACIPESRISQIIHGRRGITAETALRIGRVLGTTPELWLNLQRLHDLTVARRKKGREIEQLEPLFA